MDESPNKKHRGIMIFQHEYDSMTSHWKYNTRNDNIVTESIIDVILFVIYIQVKIVWGAQSHINNKHCYSRKKCCSMSRTNLNAHQA